MLTPKKKSCYTVPYPLPTDSILRELYIKDALLDNEGIVKLCEIDNGQLSVRLSEEGKLDAFFYKADYYPEEINIDAFKEQALEVIRKSLNRLQFAFMYLLNQRRYKSLEKSLHQSNLYGIEVLDVETGNKIFRLPDTIYKVIGEMSFPEPSRIEPLQKICEVLEIPKGNIDKYIDRFLSLENLNSDPVLHLVTLYSLYEYINKTSGNCLEQLFKGKGLEKKFKNTRHFAAHGKVEGQELKEVLENFLGVSPIGFYSFDRYNPSHVNLINEVIGEAQPIIQQYLRGELGLNQ